MKLFLLHSICLQPRKLSGYNAFVKEHGKELVPGSGGHVSVASTLASVWFGWTSVAVSV